MNTKRKTQLCGPVRGTTVLELLAAIAVFLIVTMSCSVFLGKTARLLRSEENHLTAYTAAQQAVELFLADKEFSGPSSVPSLEDGAMSIQAVDCAEADFEGMRVIVTWKEQGRAMEMSLCAFKAK